MNKKEEGWHLPDWREASEYDFADELNIGQWAWEFLRRNPDYRRDWVWFDRAWQSLEERYGRPPNRDFVRWKADPDAYRLVDDACGECRIDEDKVLIECWLGAKWGFYKFPLSPDTDIPLIGEQLLWREIEAPLHLLEYPASDWFDKRAERVVLGFELDLPLREQLGQAKRYLQSCQARLRRNGCIQVRTVAGLAGRWRLMLRLLDARDAGAREAEVAGVLRSALASLGTDAASLLEEADRLLNGGYRELARIPG